MYCVYIYIDTLCIPMHMDIHVHAFLHALVLPNAFNVVKM